ncbi:TMEM175 family protein [Streptomyces sp. S.PNR 29]|uniref:TMEM175 family protein n=1 Tax=Streptomyces sp. S.PNR 29 TaxID=2973805 RepID=UPI0025B08257|nr:TMEM175 family protein [Streptomyces sp. S.PNR 29]MDN0200093.1 TMEM175 family protein [Streptomyces sp. S.PNR 29]
MWKSPPDGGPERLIALADGVFAIAITLLVLDLTVPRGLTSAQYHEALRELVPELGAYALSFVVLAGFWRGHRQIFRTVRQVDRQVITLSMFGLGVAALLPFPTRLISDYGDEAVSVAVYAAAVASLGAGHLALLVVLDRRPWLRDAATPEAGFGQYGLDLATTVAVFLLTIPLTLVMGSGAILWWLVLIPAKIILGRRARRAR